MTIGLSSDVEFKYISVKLEQTYNSSLPSPSSFSINETATIQDCQTSFQQDIYFSSFEKKQFFNQLFYVIIKQAENLKLCHLSQYNFTATLNPALLNSNNYYQQTLLTSIHFIYLNLLAFKHLINLQFLLQITQILNVPTS